VALFLVGLPLDCHGAWPLTATCNALTFAQVCRYDRVYPLVVISSVARALLTAVQTHLEFMGDGLVKVRASCWQFAARKGNMGVFETPSASTLCYFCLISQGRTHPVFVEMTDTDRIVRPATDVLACTHTCGHAVLNPRRVYLDICTVSTNSGRVSHCSLQRIGTFFRVSAQRPQGPKGATKMLRKT
jgi:hypothetical protein